LPSEPIVIVGGGLGGIAAALALGRHGFRVRVLEQAPEFGVIGYGIQLGPNVFPMFERLGVKDAVLATCHSPGACIMADAVTGDEITRVPTGASLVGRFKHPYVVIHRVDLHRALLDGCRALDNVELIASADVVAFEERGNTVVATTADGRRFEGCALIGADGLRSPVRAQLFGDGDPVPIGYVAHRTILPMADVPAQVRSDDVYLRVGPGFHIVHYPLRRGDLFNMVAVFRTATYAEKLSERDYRAEIDRNFETAHPVMKTILGLMNFERRWPIADRTPIRVWSRGRVTLLGDAAHPTLQSLAQGACMAIEDGVTLAELIAQADGDVPAAFQRYQDARCVRTARVVLESRFLWEAYHAGDIGRDVSYQTFAERSEADIFKCLAWLYDGITLPPAARS
jgi:2-polyprenyl-6-methoxyphenol hydroxylase-like FAD-dependent oxidoreductase